MAPRSEGCMSRRYQETAHSENETSKSQKCSNSLMNDLSESEWIAGIGAHVLVAPSRYHMPSSLPPIPASVESATPSPFHSPPPPAHPTCRRPRSPTAQPR